MPLSLQEAFSSREDPRVERDKGHKLMDIIMLAICAVMSGANGREVIEQFTGMSLGQVKQRRNITRSRRYRCCLK